MEEQTISRAVHDADMARMERANKRLWIYVRLERDRAILRSHWFGGKSFVELTEKYDLFLTAVKNIIWKQGDKVLLRASKPG